MIKTCDIQIRDPFIVAEGGSYYLFGTTDRDWRNTGVGFDVYKNSGDLTLLDGTLYVDADGMPWMVFCHEWKQTNDGEMCLLPLTKDLKAEAGLSGAKEQSDYNRSVLK